MEYFFDTSYLIAITHKKDQYHNKAIKVRKTLMQPVKLTTTQADLMEYGIFFQKQKLEIRLFVLFNI